MPARRQCSGIFKTKKDTSKPRIPKKTKISLQNNGGKAFLKKK